MRALQTAPLASRAAGVVVAVVAISSIAPRAHADEKEACVAASDQAQTLRDEGKLHAARAQMVACARDVCPGIVRRDCEKMIGELDAMQPTVVLGARDTKGNDVAGTRVFLDGAALVDRLDGKPIAIDPGEHTFRYESAGAASVEQHAVIRAGEKNRILTAIVMPLAAVAPKPAPVAPIEAPADASVSTSHVRVPVASIVLASVAVVAGASFAYFGLSGQSDVSTLRATCAPNCAASDVSAARTKLLVSDVSLGVGVAALAGAAWIFFKHPAVSTTTQATSTTPPFRAEVRPVAGGAAASITASF